MDLRTEPRRVLWPVLAFAVLAGIALPFAVPLIRSGFPRCRFVAGPPMHQITVGYNQSTLLQGAVLASIPAFGAALVATRGWQRAVLVGVGLAVVVTVELVAGIGNSLGCGDAFA